MTHYHIPQESSRASAAFETYYALGSLRSLRKVAEQLGYHVTLVERWSTRYHWQARVREREQEERTAARIAARKEAASLARRRLRNAGLMQEAALTILAMAKITDMDPSEARKALADARGLLTEGMRAERLELGEVTEIQTSGLPPRPISEMSDQELDDYIAKLEQEQ